MNTINTAYPLTPAMEDFIRHWGEMGTRWGVNRSVARVHALLYLAGEPLDAEMIANTLGVARSNVSTSLRELVGWELVRMTHLDGDRRDHFEAETDVWRMAEAVVDGRRKRELDPTAAALARCSQRAEADDATPAAVRARMKAVLEILHLLSSWAEQMRRLPRATLLKLLGAGTKVARFFDSKST